MLLLLAAALASSPVPQVAVRATARVSVRIISGARISSGRSAEAARAERDLGRSLDITPEKPVVRMGAIPVSPLKRIALALPASE